MKTRSLLITALGLGAALLAGAPALASAVANRSVLPAPAPCRNVIVPVTFGKQVVGLQFSYDAQGAVAGLHRVPPPA